MGANPLRHQGKAVWPAPTREHRVTILYGLGEVFEVDTHHQPLGFLIQAT